LTGHPKNVRPHAWSESAGVGTSKHRQRARLNPERASLNPERATLSPHHATWTIETFPANT
jgi:hypothetical protein